MVLRLFLKGVQDGQGTPREMCEKKERRKRVEGDNRHREWATWEAEVGPWSKKVGLKNPERKSQETNEVFV